MTVRALFALVAILPAALNAAVPAAAHTVTVALCSGGTIEVPIDRAPAGPGQDAPCCAKACHTGQSRKRTGTCH